MDGTADRSGRISFDPLTLTLSLGERGYSGEREYTKGQGHTRGYRLWPTVRKTQPPSHFPPSRADRTGLGACRSPAAQEVNYCHG
jgi:hypothetical protein